MFSSGISGQTQLVFILPRAQGSECLGESLWVLQGCDGHFTAITLAFTLLKHTGAWGGGY